MSHKNFESLKKKILLKAKTGMNNGVLPMIRTKMSMSIREEVYSVYTPIQYSRREDNGGLSDERNIIGKTIKNRKYGFDYRIDNLTLPESVFAANVYLAPLIIMGQIKADQSGYPLLYRDFAELYPYGQPRDFIKATKKKIDRKNIASLLDDYMKK